MLEPSPHTGQREAWTWRENLTLSLRPPLSLTSGNARELLRVGYSVAVSRTCRIRRGVQVGRSGEGCRCSRAIRRLYSTSQHARFRGRRCTWKCPGYYRLFLCPPHHHTGGRHKHPNRASCPDDSFSCGVYSALPNCAVKSHERAAAAVCRRVQSSWVPFARLAVRMRCGCTLSWCRAWES